MEIDRLARMPPRTPLLRTPSGGPPAEVVAAAVGVVRSLPPAVRSDVLLLLATTVDDITLKLTSGRTVVWGGPERSGEKARILGLLLPRGGSRFDLRSPDAPAVVP
jgi:cell division protein FtsQ